MAFYPKRTGSNFTPAPAGLHNCICVDVVDLGIVKTVWQGNESLKDMVRLVWQTEALMPTGKPYIITKRYTNSTHKKATLRQHVTLWSGKEWTDAQFAAFDLEKLIGRQCMIQIIHNMSNGETYANIQTIIAAPPGKPLPKLTIRDYVRTKDRPGYTPPVHSGSVSETWVDRTPEVEADAWGDDPPPHTDAEQGAPVDEDVPF